MDRYACYIFINKRLSMGCGKKCGQSCHGIRNLFRDLHLQSKYVRDTWELWDQYSGGRTIVLYAKDEEEMEELHNSYPSVKVIDAGLTQLSPCSFTVLALYPKIHNKSEFSNKLV